MFFLLLANNFFVFYLALELQSFCFYVLCSIRRYSNLSIEASLKYFILGSFASSLFLFGISLIYGFFGTLTFTNIEFLLFSIDIFIQYNKFVIFGMIFILAGFFFKLGVVPFHF